MKARHSIQLRITALILALFIGAVSALLFYPPVAVFANSAAPVRPDSGSGIVFKEHEHIQIEGEVLNIKVNDNATADIEAVYVMKNTSEEAVSVETMFLSPVEYGENKNISVQRNGAELGFTQEFYGIFSYPADNAAQSIEDWESVLAGVKKPGRPFGDGAGFWEYTVSTADNNELSAVFSPSSIYFYQSQSCEALPGGKVKLKNYKQGYGGKAEDIVIIGGQSLAIETSGIVNKSEISDIYDYLFQRAVSGAREEQLRFVAEQFNLYLAGINTEDFGQSFFYLEYISQYIGAITYFVDFAPGELLEITVSYVYQMGTSGYRHSAELLYYLSPAKYWKAFADIEINLTLGEKYKKIRSSSLSFTKTGDKQYKFFSNILPDSELKISVGDGIVFTEGVIIVIILVSAAVLFIGAIAAALLIIVWVIRRNEKKAGR